MKDINLKSQAFYTDFIIAIMIFSVILTIYFLYTSNLSKQDEGLLDDLLTDSESIAYSLTTGGFPNNWDENNIVRMGLTNNDQIINPSLLLESSKINYNKTKRLLGTTHDFFTYFENKDGQIITFGGDYGIGSDQAYVNSSLRMAYYSHQNGDSEMKDFMTEIGADIYWKKEEGEVLMNNIDDYDLILLEDCHCDQIKNIDAFQTVEDWVFAGGLALLSEHYNNDFPNSDMGVTKTKHGGNKEALVINTDSLLNLQIDEIIDFDQDLIALVDDPANEDAIDFVMIANWTENTHTSVQGKGAIARWGFGEGDVYYFPDYHANYLEEEFVEVIEGAVQARIYQNGYVYINETYEDLVKLERLVVYNSEIVKMVVYAWE
jgi:hypothetical protein